MAKKTKPIRRFEAVDPNPRSITVKFQKPPTLAEQIARFMAQAKRYEEMHGEESVDEADDFDVDEDGNPPSPHELVFDEQLNREMPRFQKEHLDQQRAAFETALAKKRELDIAARDAARRAQAEIAARQKKKEKKLESGEPDSEPKDTE